MIGEASGGLHAALPPETHTQTNEERSLTDARKLIERRVREFLVEGFGDDPDRPVLTKEDIDQLRTVDPETLRALVREVTHMVRKAIQEEQPTELSYREQSLQDVERTFGEMLFAEAEKEVEQPIDVQRRRIYRAAHDILAEKEVSTDLMHAEMTTDMLDLDDAETPEDTRREYTNMGLDVMREALSSIDHYVIFASTAMYLHGMEIHTGSDDADKILNRPPGDLDIAMWDRTSFQQFQERVTNLSRHPNVIRVDLDRKGQSKRLTGQSTETWGGVVVLQGEEGQEVAYHFEVFVNTRNNDRLVDPIMRNMTDQKRGLTILSMDGLQRQYMKNLSLEHRVSNAATHVDTVLSTNEQVLAKVESAFTHWQQQREWPQDPEWEQLLSEIGIQPRQLAEYYILDQERRETPEDDVEVQRLLWTKITAILGEFKTKVSARKKKVQAIRMATIGEGEIDTDAMTV